MTPPDSARPPAKPPAKADDAVAAARESLAPAHTHFAHRPDWQTELDDAADAQRDRDEA